MAQKFLSVKDLAFFEDGSIQLNSLSNDEEEGPGLCLITSTLEVAATWLVDTICGKNVAEKKGQTILITFNDSSNIHVKAIKRYSGVDISNVPKSTFTIVDLSNELFVSSNTNFTANKLDKLVDIIKKSISNDNPSMKPVVIIKEPDILLASGLFTWDQVSQFVYDLRQLSSQCFVFSNADEPLIQPISPIGENQTKFLTQLIHTSSVIISLRPFETGRADDVTGILRITRGPHINEKKKVIENEYLYLVSDSVKLFYR